MRNNVNFSKHLTHSLQGMGGNAATILNAPMLLCFLHSHLNEFAAGLVIPGLHRYLTLFFRMGCRVRPGMTAPGSASTVAGDLLIVTKFSSYKFSMQHI